MKVVGVELTGRLAQYSESDPPNPVRAFNTGALSRFLAKWVARPPGCEIE